MRNKYVSLSELEEGIEKSESLMTKGHMPISRHLPKGRRYVRSDREQNDSTVVQKS